MQILSKDSMEIERHCFSFLNLFNFQIQNLGEFEGSVAQTTIEEELS
jgi:hypothetical protein